MIARNAALRIDTPEGVRFEIPLASPFSRCLAVVIDMIVIAALMLLLSQLIQALDRLIASIPIFGAIFSDFSSGILILAQFSVAVCYGMILEWLWRGKTIGKRLMKLRVIDERGLAPDFRQIVTRNLFRIIDMLPSMVYLCGGLSCFLTQHCQRLGDIAAGTLVVRESNPSVPDLEQISGIHSGSIFSTVPHIEARLRQRISPNEARLMLDALTRREELTPSSRLLLFSELAQYFREIAPIPDEITYGLSDEQFIRNLTITIYSRSSV